MNIRVFKRRVWRKEGQGYVPAPAATKRTVVYVESEEAARAICKPENAKKPETGTVGYYNFVWHEYERVS